MGSSTKQRKKTDKSSTGVASGGSDEKISVSEQLSRAMTAVENNQRTALQLHKQWRTQLLRMGYVVIIVTLHLAQAPSTSCIKEIKQWNEVHPSSMHDDDQSISGFTAIKLILNNSIVELLGVFCGASLLWCLSLPLPVGGSDFTTTPYRLSCATIPMIVSVYFSNKTLDCLAGYVDSDAKADIHTDNNVKDRNFPVVLVFHTIVSISLWFMQYQIQQHEKNIDMVKKLQHDLDEAQAARVDKKKR